MQLNQFNGGLSIRLASHLIGANEAIVYTNVDNKYGSLAPINGNTSLGTAIYKSMINFKDIWVSFNDNTDFVEYQDKLYKSNGVDRPMKSRDGITWNYLGINKPSNKPAVALNGAGALTNVLQYMYTYYNTNDGTESQPSEYSDEITAAGNKINITIVASTDPQVTNIRLYRLGNDITTPVLVVELANISTTYSDNIADTDLPGGALDSFTNAPAPTGLKYLIEAFSVFFGVVDDKLYFSDIAFPDYWNEFFYIDFPENITGLGLTQNGLLVFTKYKTYIVTGNSPTLLSKYLLNGNQGCILHKSIQYISNTLIWLSTDGICTSTGGDIQVVSRDKLDKLSLVAPVASAVYDDVYYLAHSNGILVSDFRFGGIFRNISTTVKGFAVYNDNLYACIGDVLYSIGTSTTKESITWKSPEYPDGSISNLKNYKSVYVSSTGNLTIKTYIDKVLVNTTILDSGSQEIKLPQNKRNGYVIQFEVTGTGTLTEIEYQLEVRQNGK